jgi:hypothetical protein
MCSDNDEQLALLDRRITMATEGFTTHKFCELVLKDRSRLSRICNAKATWIPKRKF